MPDWVDKQRQEREQREAMLVRSLVRRIVIGSLSLIVGLVILFGSWFTVDVTERALVMRFGQIKGVYSEGLHFKIPLVDDVETVSILVGKALVQSESSSKDLQIVHTELALNYSPDPAHVADLYRAVRWDWEARLVDPAVKEVFKAVTAQYTAETLITKRHEVSDNIRRELTAKLAPYGLLVKEISITDFDFSDSFNHAIESKQVAEQAALKAQRDLERIKTEAEQQIASARAQAESLRIQKQEVTPELIRLREVEVAKLATEKWDGKLPGVLTSGAIPFINVGPQK